MKMNMGIDEKVNNLIRLLQELYISQKSETVRVTGDMLEINGLVQTDLMGILCPNLERRGILRRGIYQLPGDKRHIGTNVQTLRRQEILEQIENMNRKSIFYNTNLEERVGEEKKLDEELEECGKVVQIYRFDIDKDRLFDDTLFFSIEKTGSGTPSESLNQGVKKQLKSIHLITWSVVVRDGDPIFLVFNGEFNTPIRFGAFWRGKETAIKKLHNLAYPANAPEKKVGWDNKLADAINNGIFNKARVKEYIKTNNVKKPTLVRKEPNKKDFILENKIQIKTELIKNLPSQFQYLYQDKTQ